MLNPLFKSSVWFLFVVGVLFLSENSYSQVSSASNKVTEDDFVRVDLATQAGDVALGKGISLYEDVSTSLIFREILEFEEDKWVRQSAEIPSLGYSKSAYWMRLALTNSTSANTSFMLNIENSALDDIRIYFERDSELSEKYVFGDEYPFDNREISNRTFIVPFQLLQNANATIYLRITNKGSLQFPVFVRSAKQHDVSEHHKSLGWGAYFGIMLVMSIYNIILFLSLRERSYLYFSLYILSSIFFYTTLNGFGFQYIWPNAEWVNHWAIPFSNVLVYATSCIFIAEFINVKKFSISQYYALRIIVYICLLLALMSPFTEYRYSVIGITLMAIPFTVVALLVNFTALRRGMTFARFFLWSWILFLLSVIMLAVSKLGVIPRNIFTEEASRLTNVVSVLLMSFALADRINYERRKRIQVKKEALRFEKESQLEHEKYLQLDLKRKEEEIDAQNKIITAREEVLLAQAQSKTKSSFLAVMSHEIRTPLNGILGMTELLWESALNREQFNHLKVIKNSGRSLLNIVNNILDFSKIEAGKMLIEKQSFDLKILCKEIIDNFYVLAQEKDILISLQFDVDVPKYVVSDVNRLRQILLNLIGNALKFTEQGQIVVKVSLPVVDEWDVKKPIIKFEVVDTGIGISKEQQKNLFRSFSQADGSTTRKYGGTGLGLSICRRLVELMNGEIGVNSELSKGATFWFTIQTEEPSSQQLKQAIDESKNDGLSKNTQYADKFKGLNILIAEDNKVNQLVIRKMLAVFGLNCDLVENGKEALAYVKKQHHNLDFVLMDCDMPIMDGYDASKRIREWEIEKEMCRIPIFALTAHALDDHKKASSESGMDAHISKPVSLKILYDAITSNQVIADRLESLTKSDQ